MEMVRTRLETGHSEFDAEGIDALDDGWETHQFATKKEAKAFLKGINLANDATHGWTDGLLHAEKVD